MKSAFFDLEGGKISEVKAVSKFGTFPWLLIRAEKTAQSNGLVKEIAATERKKSQRQAMAEILDKDQWCYDTENKRGETEVARIKLLSHLVEGQKVLEIGCGNGDLSIEMAKEGFDVVGVDISEAGIKQASEKAKNEDLDSRANFLVMDETSLDFPDNSFNSILIAEILEHVRSSRELIEEAIRVVWNGGRVVVSMPDGLLIPQQGHLRIFFKDTLTNELIQYTEQLEWHEMPIKKWLICSFFVKKKNLDIAKGPLIDIIMATYNGRKYIGNAIKSVLSQTYQNWNLIIVNDGGEDIGDVLDKFKNDKIKYIKAEHKGKAHALNVGIKHSRGEFINYLDDDDILYPIHLEVLVKAALEQKTDFVYSDWYQVSLDENGREVRRKFEYRQDVDPWMLICQNYINHKCILHRRSLLDTAGLYDEELDILIDWDMIRRLFFISKPYHTWSVTSELFLYFNQGVISNRITGLRMRDPDKARRSLEKIASKTKDLPATVEELKEGIVRSMLSLGYYHSLELSQAIQARDTQIGELNKTLQTKDTHVRALENQTVALENKILQIQRGIVIQMVNRYQRVIEKLLRSGTRRRNYYELGLTGIRVILYEGWKTFWLKLRYYRKLK
ncbi:glycosyltransferase [Chloroflexota bacterium]